MNPVPFDKRSERTFKQWLFTPTIEQAALRSGLIGELDGYRVGGKSYTPEGELVDELHDADCFCCGPLIKPKV